MAQSQADRERRAGRHRGGATHKPTMDPSPADHRARQARGAPPAYAAHGVVGRQRFTRRGDQGGRGSGAGTQGSRQQGPAHRQGTDRQRQTPTDRPTDRQTDGQTGMQANRHLSGVQGGTNYYIRLQEGGLFTTFPRSVLHIQ